MPVRLLFLDRDGTLNRTVSGRPPNRPQEVELLPGVEPVLSRSVDDGWKLVIVTNQGGVASGYLSEAQAHAVLQKVIDLLPVPVSASYLCPHLPNGVVTEYAIDCPNRKPRPGFVLSALRAFGAQAEDCLFVGDSSTDKEAAEAAGVPYQWADRFFDRPIDRGIFTEKRGWVQLRESPTHGVDAFWLRATKGGQEIGSVRLIRSSTPATFHSADVTFEVNAAHRNTGLEWLLISTSLEWAGGQPGLAKICLKVLGHPPDGDLD
jgi:D-glycero-D-manno-heptose 1,7-bisphosphate phosphatase